MRKFRRFISRQALRFWALILLVTFTFLAINNYVSVNNERAIYYSQQQMANHNQ